jgi:DNA-binding XRE family transcriptional regulator
MLDNLNLPEDDVNCEALQVDEMAEIARQRISGTQLRMARAALEMRVEDLAEKSGVSHVTISRIEDDDPKVTAAMHLTVRLALEEAGIELIDDNCVADRRIERGIPTTRPPRKMPKKRGKAASAPNESSS